MSKQLNQWLNEFIENGADATDVVNWPEDAGGGTGETYSGPYYVRDNRTLPTAGKIATQNITIDVPIKPEELNDWEIAYNNGYRVNTESVEGDVVWFYNDKTSCDASTYNTKYIYEFNDDYGMDTISMDEMGYYLIAENGGYEHSTTEYDENNIYYNDELAGIYYNAIRDGECFIGSNGGSWAVLHKININFTDGDFYTRNSDGGVSLVPCPELSRGDYYQYNNNEIRNVQAYYVPDVGIYAVGSGYIELCSLPQDSGESTTTSTSRGTYVITKE